MGPMLKQKTRVSLVIRYMMMNMMMMMMYMMMMMMMNMMMMGDEHTPNVKTTGVS